MGKRVVITGIGPVTQLGIGREDFFENLYNDVVVTQIVPRELKDRFKIKSNYYIPKVDSDSLNMDKKYSRLTTESSLLAIKAAQLAIQDAKMENDIDNNTAVLMGSAVSDLSHVFKNYENYVSGKGINRMISPMSMPNAPSAWISISLGLNGDNHLVNAACASSTFAIGEGFRKIKHGYNDVTICGGIEYLYDENLSLLKNFEALTVLCKNEEGIALPFSKKRSGFIFNEGCACCLVLEEYEHAKKRGADIYCEVVNYESLCEAHSVLNIRDDGYFITSMLKKLIKEEKIDYYNAHGTGTKLNDEVEAKAIVDIFGNEESQPFINSTKAFLGHSIGASGAIEAAVCAHSIKNNIIHGNNLVEPMSNLNLVSNHTNTEINSAISASYGFGGHNGALLFKKI
ncbi:MAG: beta-ketoacyl-[acyl-carrier-protein] synthase family protein [Lactobacillus sp.]|nr:beta-ketoacyl-[acyl-carrier-protein] synthase family protein [Lactobacillus sp.]